MKREDRAFWASSLKRNVQDSGRGADAVGRPAGPLPVGPHKEGRDGQQEPHAWIAAQQTCHRGNLDLARPDGGIMPFL